MLALAMTAFVTFGICVASCWRRRRTTPPIEQLKNSLLAHALLRTQRVDRDADKRYSAFDGSVLPHFSGPNLEIACRSYVVPLLDRLRGPFFTPQMVQKSAAIDRYIRRNLDTEEAVSVCFKTYLASLAKPPDAGLLRVAPI
jgi:hypothetical protein